MASCHSLGIRPNGPNVTPADLFQLITRPDRLCLSLRSPLSRRDGQHSTLAAGNGAVHPCGVRCWPPSPITSLRLLLKAQPWREVVRSVATRAFFHLRPSINRESPSSMKSYPTIEAFEASADKATTIS